MRSVACAVALAALTAAPAAPRRGFRAEFLRDLADVEKKTVSLAEAMPAGKYLWRPAPGVRSVSEVYMHMAGSNYVAASFFGMKPPASDEQSLERITDKERVLKELKNSFSSLRTAALNASDSDLDKTIRVFGTDTTERGALLNALTHLHEHLGQSIAYARMNGIVPPWSR